MTQTQKRSILVVIAAVAALTARVTTQSTDKLDIRAFAVNMGNIATGANAIIQIKIDSWSTPAERTRLITAMQEKGNEGALRELQKLPVHGRFNIPGLMGPDPLQLRLGHDLHYTWQEPLPEGGKRIVIATDRYISFQEARNQPRISDYPFTFFEIRVDKAGAGQGKVAVATKITWDKKKNVLELENYDTEPVRLNEVKVEVRK